MVNQSCTTCMYAWWDPGLWVTSIATGFPGRPVCANHPDTPGLMKSVPYGGPCRNYCPKPAEPDKEAMRIPLGGGQYAYVDAADYEWLSQWTWHLMNGYAGRREKNKPILMHRQITNPPKGKVVDHADHNKLDNCRANLRICDRPQNMRNTVKHRDARSQYKGVIYRKDLNKWGARLHYKGKDLWFGSYEDEVDAARAYDRGAVELFGEYAYLNFPEDWPPARRQQVHAEFQKTQKQEARNTQRKTTRKSASAGKTRTVRQKAKPKYKTPPPRRRKNKK